MRLGPGDTAARRGGPDAAGRREPRRRQRPGRRHDPHRRRAVRPAHAGGHPAARGRHPHGAAAPRTGSRTGPRPWSSPQSRAMEIQARLTPSRSSARHAGVQSQPPRAAISSTARPPASSPRSASPTSPREPPGRAAARGVPPLAGHRGRPRGPRREPAGLAAAPARAGGRRGAHRDRPPGACVKLNGVVLRQRTPLQLSRAGARRLPARDHAAPTRVPGRASSTVLPGRAARCCRSSWSPKHRGRGPRRRPASPASAPPVNETGPRRIAGAPRRTSQTRAPSSGRSPRG